MQKNRFKNIFNKVAGGAVLASSLAFTSSAAANEPQSPVQTEFSNAALNSSFSVGSVGFAEPWMLLGLGVLPILWWLMRTVPPKPEEVDFPAISFLKGLKDEEQQPHKMPLWHKTLRLTAASLVVFGLAQPEFNLSDPMEGEGPVMLVVDNGWASAKNWEARLEEMNQVIKDAKRSGRQIVILPTAVAEGEETLRLSGLLDSNEAMEYIKDIRPVPWPVNREAAIDALGDYNTGGDASIIWLSNGLDDGSSLQLSEALDEIGNVTVLEDEALSKPLLLLEPVSTDESLSLKVKRLSALEEAKVTLIASDENGRTLAETSASFVPGDYEVDAAFDVPRDVRNQVARVSIQGENSAGSVILIDERWKRRPVGLVNTRQSSQDLLNESSYVEKALSPYVDLHTGSLDNLSPENLAVMVLTDNTDLSDQDKEELLSWVKDGGTLLRFAGPELAAEPDDALLPVKLREGVANKEGAKGRLAGFSEYSPFANIKLPENVTVEHTVKARGSVELEQRTWARLDDGTPLVTAKKEGEGWIVLVHTSADASWSNLSLSGVFVDMLRAVVAHSQGVSEENNEYSQALPPIITLDGKGQYQTPSSETRELSNMAIRENIVGPYNPPGFYGNESLRHAHNLASSVEDFSELAEMPETIEKGVYESASDGSKWAGPLMTGAMSLAIIDLFLLLSLQGRLPSFRRKDEVPKLNLQPNK
jgi:hypothetical protein